MGGSGPDERRGGGERPAAGRSARAPGVPLADPAADPVAEAAAELYGAAPEAFTERRKALAAAATAAGDKRAAAAIGSLRKPTRAAWVVNQLARADRDAPARLAALAAALRAAEQGKDGPRLRELSAERGTLIDALTGEALAAAGVSEPPTSLRDEVAATLTAALADPATAAEFAAGTLTKAAHWSGFGFGSAGLAPPDGAIVSEAVSSEAVSSDGGSGDEPTRARAPSRPPRGAAAKQTGSRPRTGRTASPPDEVAARRAAQQQRAVEERRVAEERRADEQRQRLAREAAERTAERRKDYADAERTAASAVTATADAEAAEERLEAAVRDLEERLIQARADLAKARLRARHAEAAERRARQALERLPRP